MVGNAPDSIVLVWITKGETPDSSGTNMDHCEHFSDLHHALIAADPARHPVGKFPWIKTHDKWMTPDEIRQAAR